MLYCNVLCVFRQFLHEEEIEEDMKKKLGSFRKKIYRNTNLAGEDNPNSSALSLPAMEGL